MIYKVIFYILIFASYLIPFDSKSQNDTIPPLASITTKNNPTNNNPIMVDINFSEGVIDMTLEDLEITNGVGLNLFRTDTIISMAPFGSGRDVTTDHLGSIFLISTNGYQINKFELESGEVTLVFGSKGTGDGQFEGASGIASDTLGNIYITDWQLNKIQKFDNDGNFLTSFGQQGMGDGEFQSATDIEVDIFGNIYVTDFTSRIQIFDEDFNFIKKIDAGIGLRAISVDLTGNIFVIANGKLISFTSNGDLVFEISTFNTSDKLDRVTGVSVDPLGNIFIIDSKSTFSGNTRILLFSNQGEFIYQFGRNDSGNSEYPDMNKLKVTPNGIIYVTARFRIYHFQNLYKYSIELAPANDGVITVNLNESAVFDVANNPNIQSEPLTVTYDGTPPNFTVDTSEPNPTTTNPIPIIISFNEEVIDFDETKLEIDGASVNNLIGDSVNYDFELIPEIDGFIFLRIKNEDIHDLAGNILMPGDTFIIGYDSTPTTIEISSSEFFFTNANPIPIMFKFNEPVFGFEIDDINVTGGTSMNLIGSGDFFKVDIVPDSEGLITIEVPSGAVTDAIGFENNSSSEFPITYDITGPGIKITSTEPSPTSSIQIPIEITFTEPVFSFSVDPTSCLVFADDCFTADDILINDGEIRNFSGQGSVFNFDIIPNLLKMIEITVPENVASDIAGNKNSSSATFNIEYENGLVLGFNEEVSQNNIKVWQNGNWLNITVNNSMLNSTFKLFDLHGRLVLTSSIKSLQMDQDISGIKSGIYILFFETREKVLTKKVFIQTH